MKDSQRGLSPGQGLFILQARFSYHRGTPFLRHWQKGLISPRSVPSAVGRRCGERPASDVGQGRRAGERASGSSTSDLWAHQQTQRQVALPPTLESGPGIAFRSAAFAGGVTVDTLLADVLAAACQ
ncbi:hypothetical protein AAFF_G00375600 [Aldrovandia affinis]|uniref:Uncharacterized protein n=1 Tax=Aldrovandia affinis TaxID=143900 RepID=A0AAD7SG70_9TELE|nr:hypothetical protein AAFF_G00375600 [Aldrovandia affinis]